MKKLLWVVAACAAVAAWCAPSQAALTPGQKMAVDALIKQFGAADFDQRQKAVDRLVEMGPDVAPLVKKALADTADNEVKLRCGMVLKGLRDKYGADAVDSVGQAFLPVPKGQTGMSDPQEASKITLDAKDGDLADLLKQFAKQSGNSPLFMPQKWDGEPVTLSVKDMPYWQAMDKLCAAAGGLYYQWHSSTGMSDGIGLVRAANGKDIGAVVGPVSVRLVHGMEVMTLRPTKGGGVGRMGLMVPQGEGDLVSYSIDYYWEDRLPVLSDDAVVTKALGPNGKEIKIVKTERGVVISKDLKVRPFMGAVRVILTELPDGLKQVDEIDGVVKLTMGGADKTLKIDDVSNATGKTVQDGDLAVTVVKVVKTDGGIEVIAKLTKGGKVYEVPVYPGVDKYGFSLIGEEGQASVHGWVRTSNGKTAGPAPMPGSGAFMPRTGRVGQGRPATELGEGESGITFQVQEGKWTLVYTWPGDVTSKDFPFKLVNVPLP